MRIPVAALVALSVFAQARTQSGAARIQHGLAQVQVLGSVLMIAAHPDDENTALLAYFAQGRNLRTGYLSLTRGEGGQNLIGAEQGEMLGVIRTQELLAARRIDGAEQWFTRAIDFGFSKSAEETLAKWGREKVLGDVVWVIRRFRPDVVVTRFSGTPRDGHGHHQSSAILAKDAFSAAADPKRFPEQLKHVEPWQAKRLYWNVPTFGPAAEKEAAAMPNRITYDTGEFDPVQGLSYGEIAGISRSQHRSQGMGASERKGSMPNHLVLVVGEPASKDVFDGIETSWKRVPGGEQASAIFAHAERHFEMNAPEKILPKLLEARARIASLKNRWAEWKLRELDELAAQAAGLWLDISTARESASPGSQVTLQMSAVNRSRTEVHLKAVRFEGLSTAPSVSVPESPLEYNRPVTKSLAFKIPATQEYTQPYWLRRSPDEELYRIDDAELIGLPELPAVARALFRLGLAGHEIEVERAVVNRYVDPVRGEMTRPFVVAPSVAVWFPERSLVFPSAQPRKVEVRVRAQEANLTGEVSVQAPDGWRVEPPSRPFRLNDDGEMKSLAFQVTPPANSPAGSLRALIHSAGHDIRHGMRAIAYEHIPPQTIFPEAVVPVVRTDARTLARRVGYIMGAGDDVPQALRQLAVEVELLAEDDLAQGDLSRFDAIVTGVRAYNVRKDLRANRQRLMDYVGKGGTLVVQYNVLEGGFRAANPTTLERIGPYPLKVSRDRVTVEQSAIRAVRPDHPVLQTPNRIEPRDYEGWVQERGLYFAGDWDSRYEPLWEMNDPGEKPTRGGTLYARYGRGVYIFTPLAWFRQLPAGAPGAYRIFANFLSAGKALQ